ncbi:MAG TPA: methyltransferase [Balneolales bacterium]|nr:methyltransferase [Balneolales bacterium]
MSTLSYIKNFLTDKNVASITPSSTACVKHVCKKIDFNKKFVIFEYGPGTGVFSRYLLDHMTKDSRLILIELNNNFVEKLREEFIDERVRIFDDSAEEVGTIAENLGIENADYVLSGIPFSFLEDDQKLNILQQTYDLLRAGGKFLAYQTSGHLKVPIRKIFGQVHTELELLNIPPMLVYEAVKSAN